MLTKEIDIIILGAGVGGLTTAIALRRRGFNRIRIYERRAAANNIGAGLVLWANASLVLDQLGLLENIAKKGGQIEKMNRFDSQGELLGGIDIQDINQSIGSKSYSISRSDLQAVLLTEISALKIPIYFGKNAVQISDCKGETIVQFNDQSQVNAQLIIGSDGRMNSVARNYVHGNIAPKYSGFVNWIGLIESKKVIFKHQNVNDYWGIGERFGIVPITPYKGYWAGGKVIRLEHPIKFKDAKSELLKIFSNWSDEIQEIIKETAADNIKYIEVFDCDPYPKWWKKNVCLIGDAAHAALPTSGQGACQAIEDAWHFTESLCASDTKKEAFINFEKIRFEKTATITMAGRELANSLFSEDEAYCIQRNQAAKLANYKVAATGIAELWKKNL